ncbi:MAG: DUF308 domain-containing protein [Clostridia bacterium]|nr:DUF308 domain-containing protein [Clostridia bacterium]
MKKVSSGNSSLLMSFVEIAIGILLLINPVGFTSGIIITLGVILIIMGIGQIVAYSCTEPDKAASDGKLTKGILLTVLGLFCAFNSKWFIVTFPAITILYGILILVTGVSKLQQAIDMARAKKEYWFVALISALLTLLVAALIIFNPFASTAVLWTFIGVALIVEAAMDIVTFIFAKK